MCFMALNAMSQTNATIIVSYNYEMPNLKTGKRSSSIQYLLLTNGMNSKFYNATTQFLDSLESSPEGKAKLNEMRVAAYMADKMEELPQRKGSLYVIKDNAKKTITVYDQVGTEKLSHSDNYNGISWHITDSVKSVLGYECTMATANYHGRQWTVWFTPDIPLMDGPWKLRGLPGLILEAGTEDGLYLFLATGIQKNNQSIGKVYLSDTYESVSREQFWIAKRTFTDNPFRNINAQAESNASCSNTVDEHGNPINTTKRLFLSREEIDFIETDY